MRRPLTIAAISALAVSWGMTAKSVADPAVRAGRAAASETKALDDAFRIDIRTIDVALAYDPQRATVDGDATVVFRMRPGQVRPLVHFDPATRGRAVSFISLDGEPLDAADPAAVRVVEFDGTTQRALEFQRDLAPDVDHQLKMRYSLTLPGGYPRFSTEVNDYIGRGNEELFPTLNTPHELARHRITLRVAGSAPYRCLGSGWVRKTSDEPQEWQLDSEREVASYTFLFALLPESDTVWEERTIAGIPVRIMAFAGGASVPEAISKLDAWLPQLVAEIGPFPMPRGLSVFLVSRGGGMEYFGGTISSVTALRHEVAHMYFGCSAVAGTYRDSWWDEAVTSWYEMTYASTFVPMDDGFRSNIVSGRSPIAVGFDLRAYREGAQIIEAMAVRAGGRPALTRFLSYLHQNRAFSPFATLDLAEYFRQWSGIDMRDRFINWLYEGRAPDAASLARAAAARVPPDLTPPRTILKKYGLDGKR
jgi:aminopeptidase N